MKSINIKLLALLAITLLAQGCAHKSNIYYWGDYENIIQDIYLNPGQADSVTQIYKLNQTIEQAENKGLKVPPGVFAHLGMVHAQSGNLGLARESLLQEKALYPESSVFIDGLLSRSNIQGERLEANNGYNMENVQ